MNSLRIAFEPYPHLRDDSGCVLANDCVSDRAHTIVARINGWEAFQIKLVETEKENEALRKRLNAVADDAMQCDHKLCSIEARAFAAESRETDLRKALELHVAYESLPRDRGGENGSKGKAWNAFIVARDAALSTNRGSQP